MIWVSPRITRQIVRRGVILDQNFESEFLRTISKKKKSWLYCTMMKKYFFRKQKLKYTTVNVIIWCLCLCLNITTILLSFYSDFYAHSPIIRIRNMFLKNRHRIWGVLHVVWMFPLDLSHRIQLYTCTHTCMMYV